MILKAERQHVAAFELAVAAQLQHAPMMAASTNAQPMVNPSQAVGPDGERRRRVNFDKCCLGFMRRCKPRWRSTACGF